MQDSVREMCAYENKRAPRTNKKKGLLRAYLARPAPCHAPPVITHKPRATAPGMTNREKGRRCCAKVCPSCAINTNPTSVQLQQSPAAHAATLDNHLFTHRCSTHRPWEAGSTRAEPCFRERTGTWWCYWQGLWNVTLRRHGDHRQAQMSNKVSQRCPYTGGDGRKPTRAPWGEGRRGEKKKIKKERGTPAPLLSRSMTRHAD